MLELSRSGSFCHFNSPAITGRLRVHADTPKILKKIWNRLAVTNFTILNPEPEIYGILGICFYNSEAAPSGIQNPEDRDGDIHLVQLHFYLS